MQPTYSKEEANYRYSGGDSESASCATCEHFLGAPAPGQCELVKGIIRTVDTCELYRGPLNVARGTGMGGDADPAARRGRGADAAIEAFKEAYRSHPHAFDAFVSALQVFKEAYRGSVVGDDDDEDGEPEYDDGKIRRLADEARRLADACDPDSPDYDPDVAAERMLDEAHLAACERCSLRALTGERPRRVKTAKTKGKGKKMKKLRDTTAVETFRESYGPDHEITDEEVESAVGAYYAHYRAAERRAKMGR